jgi:MYXO-CTERM domain-containing protein
MRSALVLVVVSSSLAILGWPSAGLALAPETTPTPQPVPILGGDIAEPCDFPTAVSMAGSCTGTLVHPRLVVYAAHCGDVVPWIRFGDRIEDAPGFEVVPELCKTHPVGQFGFGTDAAFCRLAEPVEGIPIAPPLMGCEADAALQVGQPVTVVGYGTSDDELEPYGIKRFLNTTITALSWDEVFIGGVDEGVCYGDSGGPTYAQASDGSWRSFGITSWGQPGCGFGGYLSTTTHNIAWLETASGIDVTPCHDGDGSWDPSPECTGFDVELHASGGDWGSACDFGALSGWCETCGEPFDPDLVDTEPPLLTIVSPIAYSRVDLPEGSTTVTIPVVIEALDPGGWGVGAVELVLERDGAELGRLPDPAKPFGFDALVLDEGVWTLRAEGSDRAGNAASSAPVIFGVGIDPPPAPEPEPEPEPEPTDDTAGSDDSPPPLDGTTGNAEESGGSDDTTGTPLAEEAGCGCRSSGSPGGLLWLVFGLLALLRRRGVLGAGLLAAASCGDDIPAVATGDGSTSSVASSSTSDASTSTAPADDTTTSAELTGTSTDGPVVGCGNGIVEDDEQCDDGNVIDGDGCSAACEPSGELLEELDWPRREVDAYGVAIASARDGFVVSGWRDLVDAGTSAVVLGLSPELGIAWSTVVEGDTPAHRVFADGLAIADDGAIWAAGRSLHEQDGADVEEPWLAHFEPDGTLAWSLVMPGPTARYRDVVALPGGDAVTVGWEELADGTNRMLTRRHAAGDGSVAWTQSSPPEEPESVALSISTTAAGEVMVAGWIRGYLDYRDLRLQSYDGNGTPTGTTIYAEPLTSFYPRALATDASGDVVVCGGVVRASAENAMLGRLTPGAPSPAVWLQRIEGVGPGSTGCNGVALDTEGRVAFAGYAFYGETSFEPVVGRLAADGEILWTGRVPANEGYRADFGEGVVLDAAGDMVVVGGTESESNGQQLWVGRVRG